MKTKQLYRDFRETGLGPLRLGLRAVKFKARAIKTFEMTTLNENKTALPGLSRNGPMAVKFSPFLECIVNKTK